MKEGECILRSKVAVANIATSIARRLKWLRRTNTPPPFFPERAGTFNSSIHGQIILCGSREALRLQHRATVLHAAPAFSHQSSKRGNIARWRAAVSASLSSWSRDWRDVRATTGTISAWPGWSSSRRFLRRLLAARTSGRAGSFRRGSESSGPVACNFCWGGACRITVARQQLAS